MNITQADLAHLTDTDAKALVVALNDVSDRYPGPLGDFWRRVSVALVRAIRERATLLAVAECDLVNAEVEEGGIVEPGSDPVADALDELREQIRRGEVL